MCQKTYTNISDSIKCSIQISITEGEANIRRIIVLVRSDGHSELYAQLHRLKIAIHILYKRGTSTFFCATSTPKSSTVSEGQNE